MTKQSLGTTTVTQVGIIVDNIEAKSKAWANILGVDVPTPQVTGTFEQAETQYMGADSYAQAKLAFIDLGQVQLELIEPIGEPSTWKDQLDQHGNSIHHIAFIIKGMQETVAYLETKGISLIQKGEYTGGRYAYMDGVDQLGAVLELLEND